VKRYNRRLEPKRAKWFEKHVVDQALHKVIREHDVAATQDAEPDEAQLAREKKALRLANIIRNAEDVMAQLKRQSDSQRGGSYFVGYDRCVPIKYDNFGWRKAYTQIGVTHDELWLIVNHPKDFPNPRAVYNFLSNTWRIDWDGKSG
jgi:hypothetical protein